MSSCDKIRNMELISQELGVLESGNLGLNLDFMY